MVKNIYLIALLALMFSSCGSLTRMSREKVDAPIIYSTRDDISVTDDLEAVGKVKTVSVLFVDFYKWDEDKRQLKIGPFRFLDRDYTEGEFIGYDGLKSTFDERLATYNFISENPEIDYVTNIRFKKQYVRKPFYWRALNIGARETETTIIGKGVILKNKTKLN